MTSTERARSGKCIIKRASLLFLYSSLLAAATCGTVLSAVRLTPSNLRHWRNEELLWTRSIELFPTFESAHTNLVNVYQKRGEDELALYHARLAIEIRPDVTKYWYNLSLRLTIMKRWGEAAEFLRQRVGRVRDADHYAKTLHYHMGVSLYWMGQWGEAERELRRAVTLGSPEGRKPLETLLRLKKIPGKEERRREKWMEEQAGAAEEQRNIKDTEPSMR
eukprot:CAMPEP_0113531008 /NCGR_PEP_ID=MMETSP0015_2-20120614/3258_1 /TAXON_ID=2838 /ORGANISM="Odontella" /LENGTH=219 /DNA_ID=CAMNT_0000429797 /DNA_START=282 /DNA_END=941 /DNA_ORIENTATION=+ /assembly_acc=CAM_ASM_000160